MSDVMGVVMVLLVAGGGFFLWKQGFFDQFLQPAAAPAAAEPAPAAAAPVAVAPAPYSCPSGQILDSVTNRCIDDPTAAATGPGCHGTCSSTKGQWCCVSTTDNTKGSFEGLVGLDSFDQYFTGASSKDSSTKKSKNTKQCAADKETAKQMACDPTGQGIGGIPVGNWPLPPTAAVTPEDDALLKSDDKEQPFSTYGNAPEIKAFRDPKATGKSSDKTNKNGNYSFDHYVKKQQNFKATGFGTLGGAGYTDDPADDYELGFGFYASRVRPSI